VAADNVFDFAAQMLFQGLTSAVYVRANSSDQSFNGTAASMVRGGDADVEWRVLVDTVRKDRPVFPVKWMTPSLSCQCQLKTSDMRSDRSRWISWTHSQWSRLHGILLA
jgi:hypothetical protein